MGLEDIIDKNIGGIVEASEDPEETIKQLSNQIRNRRKQLEDEYWERNRFCSCGAESILECECATDKKWRYMKRTSRKINKELGEQAAAIQMMKTAYGLHREDSSK